MSTTLKLIITNVVMFILTMFIFPSTFNTLAIYPLSNPNFSLWQPFTSMFLHANFTHLLINMFVLYSFGSQLEKYLGKRKYLILYILVGILSGLTWIVAGNGPAVGASGALCGLMSAFLIFEPESKVLFLFVIPMKIKTAIFSFGIFSIIFAVLQFINPAMGFGVGHIVHLSGLVVGYLITAYWKKNNELYSY